MGSFPFKYDLHVHTKETSRCGRVSASEMVVQYKKSGYTGFALTDHYNGSLSSMTAAAKRDFSHQDMIDRFLCGYHEAKKAAVALDFEVILGCELRFNENDNDYLIFGMDEDFFYQNGDLRRLGIAEFHRRFAGQLVIIQAHPYRDGNETVLPQYLHGVEVLNLNARHDNCNDKAASLAERYNLISICGSDAHQPEDIALGNVSFEKRLRTSSELAAALLSRSFLFGKT